MLEKEEKASFKTISKQMENLIVEYLNNHPKTVLENRLEKQELPRT